MKENPVSFQLKLNPEDFLPATEEEKQSQVIMRESVSFWKDGGRRLVKNKVAMTSIVVVILVMIFSFIVPSFYPYSYKDQIKGGNNLAPMEYSADEQGIKPDIPSAMISFASFPSTRRSFFFMGSSAFFPVRNQSTQIQETA